MEQPLPSTPVAPVLIVALDGWTDAGEGGSAAAEALQDAFETDRVATFDPDALFDYRDRRPELEIDAGELGQLKWPQLSLDLVTPPSGPPLLTLTGPEPDLSWHKLGNELVTFCRDHRIRRYYGLGSVPGPIPHTRPVNIICTGNDTELVERLGRAHEKVIVPASCQVVLEKMLGDAGVDTVGMWARVPHYVAGNYPQASKMLLERLSANLGIPVDVSVFDDAVDENHSRLDLAAASSSEVTEHVRQLEQIYDAETAAERRAAGSSRSDVVITEADVPTADELAAEIERFLRGREH